MADDWSVSAPPAPSASTPVFLTTLGIVLAVIAAILVVDLWLANIDARESRLHALHLFEDGQALLAANRPGDAVDRFASAQALERSNVRYGVALAEALLADARATEAEAQLRPVLGRAETDGAANLVMAHILARQNRLQDAASSYHRAIYGVWSADSSGRPLQARLELIDLLARRNAKRELLAELLPLQDVDTDSVALRRRIGHLFVQAGSPERALPIFRELLKRDTNDGDAFAGMGDAALLLGNFRTARADLVLAARLLDDSVRFASSLQIADTALALDPRALGVGRVARYQRARMVLELTVEATAACGLTPGARQLADSARIVLSTVPMIARASDTEEADPLLALASEIWSRRDARCPPGTRPTMRALELIQGKLS